jgi:glycosyltransferase involved in cell wall biosynthesis
MKFIVAQIGARRSYAIPSILARAGMLELFYTDACADVGLGKFLPESRLPFARSAIGRLASRRLPPEIRRRTRTFGGPLLRHSLRSALGGKDPAARFREHLRWTHDLGGAMARAGFGRATHVYSMLDECGALLIEAKRRGLTVISEVYILLSAERVVMEERGEFPQWESAAADLAAIRRECSREDVLLICSDFFLCPSEAVRDDLAAHWGVARERTALAPYGVDPRWLELEPRPERGRVLFAGTAELRKGIHYLAMAAERLKRRGRPYEFRVAGTVTEEIARRPECAPLNFLGRVPRDRMREEFGRADVFVLPSLAEGSAEVTYEALAAGLPVITTRAAGSVARDEIEGRIVPERDPAALAEAIESVIEDRALREQMAAAARERARDYTWEKYGARLVAALREFQG